MEYYTTYGYERIKDSNELDFIISTKHLPQKIGVQCQFTNGELQQLLGIDKDITKLDIIKEQKDIIGKQFVSNNYLIAQPFKEFKAINVDVGFVIELAEQRNEDVEVDDQIDSVCNDNQKVVEILLI